MSEQPQRTFIVSDTSVLLSFVCANKHRLLTEFTGDEPLYIPSAVAEEMERKLRSRRFSMGVPRWRALLNSAHLVVLEDDQGLITYVRGYAGVNYTVKSGLEKDLGEYMCLAHCLREKEKGRKVAIIADDGGAHGIARKREVPAFSSEQVLLRAVRLGRVKSREEARSIWKQLSQFDVHVRFEETVLNRSDIYPTNS